MEAAAPARSSTVCVTGAGGFVASWLVKLLLSGGRYAVRGTARDPGAGKNAHLMAMDGASERLSLVQADMLDYSSVASAVAGCEGVFHVASPVLFGQCSNPEADVIAPSVTGTLNVLRASFHSFQVPSYYFFSLKNNNNLLQVDVIAPAVTGTLNVLKACHEAKVKRVVLVSSVAAVFNNPDWPKGKAFDEDSWSDEEYCRKIEEWYFLSKILAEREAFVYAAKTGLDIVSVCPCLVIGPLLQSTVPTSVKYFLGYIKGGQETGENRLRNLVDVRDVADALLLAYENSEASGRYLCSSTPIRVSDIMNILKSSYPTYSYPKSFVDVEDNITYNTEKLQKLGWSFRPIEETIQDSIQCYGALGILN